MTDLELKAHMLALECVKGMRDAGSIPPIAFSYVNAYKNAYEQILEELTKPTKAPYPNPYHS